MILLVHVPDLKTYRDNPERILDRSHACPACGHHPLARHGTRSRWFFTAVERIRSRVYRMQCGACGATVTLLPDFLVPRFRYVAELIQQVITAYLGTTASYRSLAVQIAGGVLQDMDSVTDALQSVQLRPSYQRIHAWVNGLAELAASFTQDLATWILRLRPDSLLLHLLATPTLTFDTKTRSEAKQRELRACVLLRAIQNQTPELSGAPQGAWLAHLGIMAQRFLGRSPPRSWAGPPST